MKSLSGDLKPRQGGSAPVVFGVDKIEVFLNGLDVSDVKCNRRKGTN